MKRQQNIFQSRAIINEMLLKAIPKDLVTEAVQKMHEDPMKAMLMIMVKYQPGGKKEKKPYCSRSQILKLVGMKSGHLQH